MKSMCDWLASTREHIWRSTGAGITKLQVKAGSTVSN
jgi:hypothetical protein